VNEERVQEIDFSLCVVKEIDMRDSLCLRVLRHCVYRCLRHTDISTPVFVFGRQMPGKGDLCKTVYAVYALKFLLNLTKYQ